MLTNPDNIVNALKNITVVIKKIFFEFFYNF
jgi:hypothetical protein